MPSLPMTIPILLQDGREFGMAAGMPRSMIASMDLAGEIPLALDDDLQAVPASLRLRVFGAALGLALGGQRLPWVEPTASRSGVPVYSGDGALRAYGTTVLEALYRHGMVATQATWTAAIHYMLAVQESLPTEEGVRRAQNFTSPAGDGSTPGSA